LQQLKAVVREAGLTFEKQKHTRFGSYFSLGQIGDNRVNAVKTEGMGPHGHGGSAAKALQFKSATGATGLIQLGMAFGVNPEIQRKGDVLVSTALIPYDNRNVGPTSAAGPEIFPLGEAHESPLADDEAFPDSNEAQDARFDPLPATEADAPRPAASSAPSAYLVDYRSRVVWNNASPTLLRILATERDNPEYDHKFFFGGMLSGGARIFSSVFLRELLDGVPSGGDDIVGGDMEGVGLLASSPREDPAWVVVKAISDFADDARHTAVDPIARTLACRNSARYVIKALARSKVS
jgi:adenosylhomocysteine nucleosidase